MDDTTWTSSDFTAERRTLNIQCGSELAALQAVSYVWMVLCI